MRDFKKLTIKNLVKKYGNQTVLNDFNLTLEKGEFVTFLGPSGCGKSTALNCISGLVPLTSGEIYIDDECIDDSIKKIPPEKRDFGMVFQNYALFPHLTVNKNVAFGLELKKMDRKTIEEKVKQALSLVHLEEYGEKYPGQLSGGQQQRVAIARCIVMEPKLLLLDEPLSNLDAKLRNDMRYEIKSIHERLHITSIYVTHDQQEALALSDRIVVMKAGCIQQIGTPEEIYSEPVNLFVADFMGFRNQWKATIENISEQGDDFEIAINVNGIKLLSRYKDKDPVRKLKLKEAFKNNEELITAIRPEDIVLGEGPVNNITCSIDIVEYLGQTCSVSAKLKDGSRVDMKTSGRIRENENINIYIPPEKIQVFAREVS